MFKSLWSFDRGLAAFALPTLPAALHRKRDLMRSICYYWNTKWRFLFHLDYFAFFRYEVFKVRGKDTFLTRKGQPNEPSKRYTRRREDLERNFPKRVPMILRPLGFLFVFPRLAFTQLALRSCLATVRPGVGVVYSNLTGSP